MMRLFSVLVLSLLFTACGLSEHTGRIPFVSVEGARGPAGGLDGSMSLPQGAGPFLVVILLHGCGGLGSTQTEWAERLNDWGYAALILDSFGQRGIRSVCAPGSAGVTVADRASDVISAALWLRGQARIDPNRIGVIGESHGGATAVWVTRAVYERLYPGLLKAVVDYYGTCRRPELHGTLPLLALAGDADTWNDPALTCRAFAQAMRLNQPFEVHTYPGVVHHFDDPRYNARLNYGHPMAYNHDAAEDSYVRVHAFLDHWLMSSG